MHTRRPRGGLSGREIRRRKFSRTVDGAAGMPLLTTRFHDSFQCLSLIGNKIYFYAQRRPASIAAFMVSRAIARQVRRTVEFAVKLLGIRRSRKQHDRCWPPLGHKNIHFWTTGAWTWQILDKYIWDWNLTNLPTRNKHASRIVFSWEILVLFSFLANWWE